MRFHHVVLVLALGVVIAAPRAARADDPPMSPAAAALWDQGQALYRDGRYLEAIDHFERGRAIEPRPDFLYAQGQAARKAGDCLRAIELYRRFVIEANTPAQVEAGRLQIARCESDLATPASGQPLTAPGERASAAPTFEREGVAAPVIDREHPPWYRNALGVGLVVGGAVALGTGTVFLVRSRRPLDGERDSYGQFERGLDDRKRDGAFGFALLGVAGALTAGAVIRFWVWPGEVEGSAAMVATPGGAAAMVRGQF